MKKFTILALLFTFILTNCKNDDNYNNGLTKIYYKILLEEDYSQKGVYAFDQRVYLKNLLYYFDYEKEQWIAVSDGKGLPVTNWRTIRDFDLLSLNDSTLVFWNPSYNYLGKPDYLYRNQVIAFQPVSEEWYNADDSFFDHNSYIRNPYNNAVYQFENKYEFELKKLLQPSLSLEKLLKIPYVQGDSLIINDIFFTQDTFQFVLSYNLYNPSYGFGNNYNDSTYFYAFYDKQKSILYNKKVPKKQWV